MLRSVCVDALDEGLFSVGGKGALREGVVVWSVDDVDVDVAICKQSRGSVYLATLMMWKEGRTGLSSLAVGRERHLVRCWAAVEREMDRLDVITLDRIGHGVDASQGGHREDRKGQLHGE